MKLQSELLIDSVLRLDEWLESNGWAGYDPYDIQGLQFFLGADHGWPRRFLKRSLLLTSSAFPNLARRGLRISKQVNAKAMGLFAEAYRRLYETTGDEQYLEKAQEALRWLRSNPSRGYAGLCWGYPFHWQSRILIPRDTPSAVVSTTVGAAFWGFYQMTAEREYLDDCQRICEFLVRDLNKYSLGDGGLCFSYTPLDNFHVHNANLFVADFLIKIGLEIEREEYIDLGRRAVAYTLREQNEDGSICYWGRDQSNSCHIDQYHSGFELRSLHSIWKTTSDSFVETALRRYYDFYCSHLFTEHGLPKATPESIYPINIHGCAEAILCHSVLLPTFPESGTYLKATVPWVIENMQNSEGWFIYSIRARSTAIGTITNKVSIPYIRWGQGWMLLALSTAMLYQQGSVPKAPPQ